MRKDSMTDFPHFFVYGISVAFLTTKVSRLFHAIINKRRFDRKINGTGEKMGEICSHQDVHGRDTIPGRHRHSI